MAKQTYIKAIAKFSRTYATNFKTKEGQECDVPDAIFKARPNHFIVQMVDKDVVKLAKKHNVDPKLISSNAPAKPETAAEKKTRIAEEKKVEAETKKLEEEKAKEIADDEAYKMEITKKCAEFDITQEKVIAMLGDQGLENTQENQEKLVVELIAKAESEIDADADETKDEDKTDA